MKIKVKQLDSHTRRVISRALLAYIPSPENRQEFEEVNTYELSAEIEHGELLLCEYQYPEQQEGGEE